MSDPDFQSISIYTDGGARGNPGPAASAYHARTFPGQRVLSENAVFLGHSTNNIAEYNAFLLALRWLSASDFPHISTVNFFSDSLLVVSQLNHRYKIKDAKLKELYSQVQGLLADPRLLRFHVTFKHIPRSQNAQADRLVNQVLDKSSP